MPKHSAIQHSAIACSCAGLQSTKSHRSVSVQTGTGSVELPLARVTIAISIHFGIRAVLQEENGFGFGAHLAAMLTTVTAKHLRLGGADRFGLIPLVG